MKLGTEQLDTLRLIADNAELALGRATDVERGMVSADVAQTLFRLGLVHVEPAGGRVRVSITGTGRAVLRGALQ